MINDLKLALVALVCGLVLLVNRAKADDPFLFEYKELTIHEENGRTVVVAYFVESIAGDTGDPDFGVKTCDGYADSGRMLRYECKDEHYLYAAGAFGDPRATIAEHIDENGKTYLVPAYVIRIYPGGCRSELDTDMTVRRYCSKPRNVAPYMRKSTENSYTIDKRRFSAYLDMMLARGYRYPKPVRHKGPRRQPVSDALALLRQGTTQMKKYIIRNHVSGKTLGVYVANSADCALDVLANDAGCATYRELCAFIGMDNLRAEEKAEENQAGEKYLHEKLARSLVSEYI